jgi:hypothetical protein
MKKQTRNLALVLLNLLWAAGLLSAQNENIWRGGKPGRASDWNIAANWSKNRVPNEFDQVVIPGAESGSTTRPFISGEVVIGSLYMESGAEIVLRDHAMLVVLRIRGCEEGATMCAEPDPHALQIDVNDLGEVVAFQGARR